MVISGGKLFFNHEIPKEKWQILRALCVAYCWGPGAQESVQHEMSEPTIHNAADSFLLCVGWSCSAAKGNDVALFHLWGGLIRCSQVVCGSPLSVRVKCRLKAVNTTGKTLLLSVLSACSVAVVFPRTQAVVETWEELNMAWNVQTSCRKIFQRRVPNIGLLNPPTITDFQDVWYRSHSQILFSFFFSFLFTSCLPERSPLLTSGHWGKFSAGFWWHRITLPSVIKFSFIQLKIWFIINTIPVRKENSLPRHYVKLNSAEGNGSSMCSLQWIGENEQLILTIYKQHWYCNRLM